eukprot:5885797-Pyramimonas_sp.AAC.1
MCIRDRLSSARVCLAIGVQSAAAAVGNNLPRSWSTVAVKSDLRRSRAFTPHYSCKLKEARNTMPGKHPSGTNSSNLLPQ